MNGTFTDNHNVTWRGLSAADRKKIDRAVIGEKDLTVDMFGRVWCAGKWIADAIVWEV